LGIRVQGFEFEDLVDVRLGTSGEGLGIRVSGFAFQVLRFGFQFSGLLRRCGRNSGSGIRASVPGIRDSGFGFRGSRFGPQVSGSGIRHSGFGVGVYFDEVPSFVFRGDGFGFRDSGFGVRVDLVDVGGIRV